MLISVTLKELNEIKWISNSYFVSYLDKESCEDILIPVKLIPDFLTDERLKDVFDSIRFFGGEPINFLDYVRTFENREFDILLSNLDSNTQEYKQILFIKEFNSIKDEKLCEWAASNGMLNFLKYAHEKGYHWNKSTTTNSVMFGIDGYLDCLQYAHENGCPWDDYTTTIAAAHGKLKCLKYAFENGCPCDEQTITISRNCNQMECYRYLVDNSRY